MEETECLADVGHDAEDFEQTRHRGLLNILEEHRLRGGFDALHAEKE